MTLESSLIEGRTTKGVVRIGDTVRRPLGPHSKFVHSLLKLLEKKGFGYSPRFLGIDERNREILTYIDGIVPHGELLLNQSQLIKIVEIMKRFHDATEGSELAESKEVVCHNDFAPWNIVFHKDKPIGIIDFDNANPGDRIDDLAYFLWTFLSLGNDNIPTGVQIKKIKLLCAAYGFSDGNKLVEAILKQQARILNMRKTLSQNGESQSARNFSASKVIEVRAEIEWVKNHRFVLENSLSN